MVLLTTFRPRRADNFTPFESHTPRNLSYVCSLEIEAVLSGQHEHLLRRELGERDCRVPRVGLIFVTVWDRLCER